MKNNTTENKNMLESPLNREEIGSVAKALDKLSIRERVKVGKKVVIKIAIALLLYFTAIVLMALLI